MGESPRSAQKGRPVMKPVIIAGAIACMFIGCYDLYLDGQRDEMERLQRFTAYCAGVGHSETLCPTVTTPNGE